jgi:RimJ/RimL family protein N-acetyltransferase
VAAIRPLEPEDGDRIREIWDAMSDESRRRRFLSPANEVSEEDIRYLVDVDHKRHEALLALDEGGHGVGVARFVRTPGDRSSAEVAVVVVDAWHRRGLGTALLDRLTERAREQGIERYTAIVSADNDIVLRALDRAGAVRTATTGEGEVEFAIPLPERGIAGGPAAALRAAAEAPFEFLTAVVRRVVRWRWLG